MDFPNRIITTSSDTKLVSKSLVSELTAVAPTIWKSTHGRRSLLYLIAPRSRRHFTPAQIATLAETDVTKAQTSKKDGSVRATEILKAASGSLLEFVARHGKEAVLSTGGSLLVLEIMLQADGGAYFRSCPCSQSSSTWTFLISSCAGRQPPIISHPHSSVLDQSAATQTLLELIATPYPVPATSPPHPIDSSHVARLYKTLLQGGHFDQSSKSIAKPSHSFSPSRFASSFLGAVGRDVTVAMAQGNGAFVIAELCNRVSAQGTREEKTLLQTWFTEGGVSKSIQEKEMKGKSVLLESIGALLPTFAVV